MNTKIISKGSAAIMIAAKGAEEIIRNVEVLSENAARELVEELYTTHYAPVYRYLAFRLSNKSDAEDLAQTVFVKALVSLKNGIWDGGGGVYYLFTIARNTLIDHFRRSKHTPVASDDLIEGVADRVTTAGPVESRERRELISAAMTSLRASEIKAVTLRFFEDLEYAVIAKIMGKREDAVRQLVHRGLKTLKGLLHDEGVFAS